jgi:hypothetical protein
MKSLKDVRGARGSFVEYIAGTSLAQVELRKIGLNSVAGLV